MYAPSSAFHSISSFILAAWRRDRHSFVVMADNVELQGYKNNAYLPADSFESRDQQTGYRAYVVAVKGGTKNDANDMFRMGKLQELTVSRVAILISTANR
jgi:hypothetical protein